MCLYDVFLVSVIVYVFMLFRVCMIRVIGLYIVYDVVYRVLFDLLFGCCIAMYCP